MCRQTSGGTSPVSSDPHQKLSPASILKVQQWQHAIAPMAAPTAGRRDHTHAHASSGSGETVSSISSSVFRRDDRRSKLSAAGRQNAAPDKTAADLLSEECSLRDARLDAQHRLRLTPAALWGERARLTADAKDAADGEETEPAAAAAPNQQEQRQQRTFLTEGAPDAPSAKEGAAGSASKLNHRRGNSDVNTSAGRKKKKKNDTTATRTLSSAPHGNGHGPVTTTGDCGGDGGDGSGFVLSIGASAPCAQAASLKRTAVTASVPLRWQSRVIALSSLRDSFREGATRGSPSMGRKMAIRRCRTHCKRTKAKRCGTTMLFYRRIQTYV